MTINYLNSNAQSESTGKCAQMIRLAINAGGIDITPHPISAKDYGPYLTKYGFLQTNDKFENAKKGDITVIQPYQGQNHSHGHIAMYTGSMWIPDFKQRICGVDPDTGRINLTIRYTGG